MTFHHIGIAVKTIDQSAPDFLTSFLADWDGVITTDPVQRVRVCFLYPRIAGMPVIELIEPLDSQSPVSRFLAKGGALHHFCFEVDLLDQHLECYRGNGDVIVQEPVPAVAFNQRRIAWVYTKQRMLLEFLEASAEVRIASGGEHAFSTYSESHSQ